MARPHSCPTRRVALRTSPLHAASLTRFRAFAILSPPWSGAGLGQPGERRQTAMNHPASAAILERARRVTPGGVNTSIRRVDPMPIWSRAAGSRVYDVQGREYIDRTLSAAEDAFRRLVHGESRPVALQSVGTESGEPK